MTMQIYSHSQLASLITTMADILKGKCSKKIGYTLRVGGRGSKIDDRHIGTYSVDGEVKRITPSDGLLMRRFSC